LIDEFEGDIPLRYDREKVVFRQEKPKKADPSPPNQSEFKAFLQDL
jgi:hypothetical protein